MKLYKYEKSPCCAIIREKTARERMFPGLKCVTVHYVEEEVDTGEIIAARKCEIEQGMALCELEGKIHQIEHNMYPKIIEEIL